MTSATTLKTGVPLQALPLLDVTLRYLHKDANDMLQLLQTLDEQPQPLDHETWSQTAQAFASQYKAIRVVLDILTQWRHDASNSPMAHEVDRLTDLAFSIQDRVDHILLINDKLRPAND